MHCILNHFLSTPVLADNPYGNYFSCLAQLSNCKEEGVINQETVEDHRPLPSEGMEWTTEAWTTKEKVKWRAIKRGADRWRWPQVSFANATLAFSTIFKVTISQVLLPELSEMPGLSARAS